MKRLDRKRLGVLTIAVMLLGLTACGDDGSDDPGNSTAAKTQLTDTSAKTAPTSGQAADKWAQTKAKAKAKARAHARAKRDPRQPGAGNQPAADENVATTVPPLSDEEVLRRLEKLGYKNRALTPSELVEHCKGTAASARKLSDAERQRLVGICNEAASGSRAEIKAAAVEVCRAAIESELPKEAPIYESALEGCEKTGDAPAQARP